ncbi:uncharacterized protein LOC128221314 [Mya arenaria]|uniref:uncharacterized protein LOC128221314 n=1 Tax=Mya arenaria TaxID=6604 RepID=UPI0022E6BCA5|nr:uncharacterized protein LOC128221314 [Mya arenaria]
MERHLAAMLLTIMLICGLQTVFSKSLITKTQTQNETPHAVPADKGHISASLVASLQTAIKENSKNVAESTGHIKAVLPGVAEHAFMKVDPDVGGATFVIQGHSSLHLFDPSDIDHPSFDPRSFLNMVSKQSVQPVEIVPVTGMPYFMFMPADALKNETDPGSMIPGMQGRRRVKRHHPNLLQSVIGQLQNFALVPIKSGNGKLRYILLKNPKFVIGKVPPGNDIGNSGPAVIQLAPNPPVRPRPTNPPTRQRQRPVLRSQTPDVTFYRDRPTVPVASPIDSIFNGGSVRRATASNANVGHLGVHNHNVASAMAPMRAAPTPGTQTVQKTEVVETVVETSKQDAASSAAKQEVAGAASSSVSSSGIGGTETKTAAAESKAAASSSAAAATEAKSVKKVKKTTTTVVHSAGGHPASGSAVGGVQEVTQVVEEVSQHQNASSASAASASASQAAASESSATSGSGVSNGAYSLVGDTAAAVAASSSVSSAAASAAATNTSTTSVKKTTKTTTVTKQNGATPVTGAYDAAFAEVHTGNGASKTPTAILSNNNEKLGVIDSKSAMIATERPRAVAPIVGRREPSSTTPQTSTEEQEVEGEEVTVASSSASQYTDVRAVARSPNISNAHAQYRLPQGAVGWAASNPDTALGASGRVNTTDVPVEIALLPNNNTQVAYTVLTNARDLGQNSQPEINLLYRHKRALRDWYVYYTRTGNAPKRGRRPGASRPAPSSRSNQSKRVAGWSGGPATPEPALGANDRVNTTDLPEEIEIRPDKTPAERRLAYRLKNPKITEAEILAKEKKMFAARARANARQAVPVQLAPPVYATLPPGATDPPLTPKPKPPAQRPPAWKSPAKTLTAKRPPVNTRPRKTLVAQRREAAMKLNAKPTSARKTFTSQRREAAMNLNPKPKSAPKTLTQQRQEAARKLNIQPVYNPTPPTTAAYPTTDIYYATDSTMQNTPGNYPTSTQYYSDFNNNRGNNLNGNNNNNNQQFKMNQPRQQWSNPKPPQQRRQGPPPPQSFQLKQIQQQPQQPVGWNKTPPQMQNVNPVQPIKQPPIMGNTKPVYQAPPPMQNFKPAPQMQKPPNMGHTRPIYQQPHQQQPQPNQPKSWQQQKTLPIQPNSWQQQKPPQKQQQKPPPNQQNNWQQHKPPQNQQNIWQQQKPPPNQQNNWQQQPPPQNPHNNWQQQNPPPIQQNNWQQQQPPQNQHNNWQKQKPPPNQQNIWQRQPPPQFQQNHWQNQRQPANQQQPKGQNGRTGYVTEPMYPVTQPPTPPPRRRNNRRRFRNPPQRTTLPPTIGTTLPHHFNYIDEILSITGNVSP